MTSNEVAAPAHVLSRDGTPIAYETAGSGPSLVIVGGAFSTRADARDLVAALSGQRPFSALNAGGAP